MEINKLVLVFILILGNIPTTSHAILDLKDIQETYGETCPYVRVEPIPIQQVNSRFSVKALVSDQIRKIYPNQELAISATLPTRDKNFYVYDFPQDATEIISDQGGLWEWRVEALEPGSHTLYLNIGILKSGPNNSLIIEDNCSIPIQINVENLPLTTCIWNGIKNNWISIFGWIIAIPSVLVHILSLIRKKS